MKIEGLRELENKLNELGKSASKTVMRNTLKKAAEPIAESARASAPVDTGNLKASIGVSTKLSKAQKRAQAKSAKASGGKDFSEIFVGSASPVAHLVEFGTAPHINQGKFAGSQHPGTSPQPFMRPAWESNKDSSLDIIKSELASQIVKAAGRAAKKAAKKGK